MSGAGYATPSDRFYVRNHGPTPSIDVASWTLRVKGLGVSRGLSLSYEDLLALPAVSVTRALECTGNGRIFFGEQEVREAEGTPWRLGAIGVAEWTGVPLRLLLEEAGLEASATEVMPEGLDEPGFARTLPLSKALKEDIVLAYLMNGEPLPPDHAYPVRLVVPGWAAMASVKWVGRDHRPRLVGRRHYHVGRVQNRRRRMAPGRSTRTEYPPAPGSASPSSGKQRPESTNCGCERPTLRAISSRRACRTTSRATSTTPSSPTRLQFINRRLVHLWRPLTVRYLKRWPKFL